MVDKPEASSLVQLAKMQASRFAAADKVDAKRQAAIAQDQALASSLWDIVCEDSIGLTENFNIELQNTLASIHVQYDYMWNNSTHRTLKYKVHRKYHKGDIPELIFVYKLNGFVAVSSKHVVPTVKSESFHVRDRGPEYYEMRLRGFLADVFRMD